MINQHSNWARYLAGVLAFFLCTTLQAHAQFPGGGGGGGFGGGGGGRGGGGGGSTTRQYYNNGMIGDAVITVDPETRRLIVITDDETSRFVAQVITNLDRPKPQVLIKVVFVEITHSDGSDIGVEGTFRKGIGSSTTAAVSNLFGMTPGLPGTPPLTAPPGAGIYQLLGQDYQVTLRAIAQAGKAEVLSRPSILARNNQPATILVGQSVPLTTSVRYDTLGNAINGVTYTDVGIILRVTPFITSDGMVEMIISPELSSVSATDKVPIANGVQAPVIDKRSADTVVVTPDGQPVIIGGLMQSKKTQNDSKIPFLGDIPGLGALFKRRSKDHVKTELIIFLTPHIVKEPSQLAGLSASERGKAELTPTVFSEKELDRLVDGLPAKDAGDSTDKAPAKSDSKSKKKRP